MVVSGILHKSIRVSRKYFCPGESIIFSGFSEELHCLGTIFCVPDQKKISWRSQVSLFFLCLLTGPYFVCTKSRTKYESNSSRSESQKQMQHAQVWPQSQFQSPAKKRIRSNFQSPVNLTVCAFWCWIVHFFQFIWGVSRHVWCHVKKCIIFCASAPLQT